MSILPQPTAAQTTTHPSPTQSAQTEACETLQEYDSTGLVFGLMPHPEAIYAKWLHPNHTSNEPVTSAALADWEGEGLQIFRNAVEYVRKQA